ncbi:MAG TPA: T9SS type A sorting domain-containing protein, partial [Bacteroidetes bacterium]|nr:T9SS type A sorting domain-containing protein [Bacteroidota bacterium]
MKKSILLFYIFFVAGALSAQITVTNATFPQTGDTLRTMTDFNPSGIEITPSGGPYDWDFTSLNTGVVFTTDVYLDASEGSAFDQVPEATHVVINDQLNGGGEGYYRISGDKMEFLAANGNDPVGIGISSLFRFSPPILQRRAPMIFPANNTTEANLAVGMAWSDLPAIITDSLPLPVTPDSIRVRIVNTRTDFVDAYGTLSIPGGTYEVLREKRTLLRDTKVEAKVPVFGWQDVTDLLLSQFPQLGTDTIISYNFFSNTEKEIIATVTVDANDTPLSVTFKNNDIISGSDEILPGQPVIEISPNPADPATNVTLSNFTKGQYHLDIRGQYGQLVFTKIVDLNNETTVSINLSTLPAATYYILLKNNDGKTIAVEKLI